MRLFPSFHTKCSFILIKYYSFLNEVLRSLARAHTSGTKTIIKKQKPSQMFGIKKILSYKPNSINITHAHASAIVKTHP